ncbi:MULTISPECIES: IDEAL domain-containing protein [Staphylococcus]|uniref:IDEAL domain-containing protein n=1 Tax=Staphylococcus caprae TaxID=29380 RepID=A0ABN5W9R2_9STAP|nr:MULTISPECIES: IDEAL domain-containing protein [Staphylococcus]EES40735.1 IDEAL domain protein [Staphylococcus caprae M23864:W1]MBN6825133.1 IDEAL domain-containing protein [Staphylococcus caprae]MBX5317005.1 IDEAL domain-containing protein [Staphylococcus caprae]MBX5319168.1 IDEAL domain-containing protein [Staphylococcus caprae]MBX5322407.1 IDEAL domain-containing protein [Staphylococcus caprae]
MNHNTNVKHTTLEDFVTTVNDLGVELVIDEALREARKKQLKTLIDEALVNKNKEDFIQYTEEYKKLEAFLSE